MAPSRRLLQLVAVMCESLLVGGYAVLLGVVIWILSTQSTPRAHKILFAASISMFVISVVHLGLFMQDVSSVNIPVGNFQAQIILSTFQFIIGDLVLIWRVWIIWGRNYWIASGPLAIMIAAAGLTFNLATGTETRSFYTAAPVALIVANTSICTLLIAGRIWYMRYQIRKFGGLSGGRSYMGALSIIIESGALYALSQLCGLILDHVKSPGLVVMLNLEIPLIGILPTLIIVLVHFDMVPGTSTSKRYAQNTTSQESSHITLGTIRTETTMNVGERIEFKSGSITSGFGDERV
ncbi:hypothetical protein BDZ94DRAFT_854142 [Collybia nuda]|uniref:Uncharacterized protein n=1 Tax=Collybia nuda TaxID=64659 RepID=A0A9P6CHR0_9AGAR|nr:hypothetical protein BDZ94DRAFT_854142 [Collybia nuda]